MDVFMDVYLHVCVYGYTMVLLMAVIAIAIGRRRLSVFVFTCIREHRSFP